MAIDPQSKIGVLRPPKAPNLPNAPREGYDAGYFDQFSNVLRLYFNQIDNLGVILAGQGGALLSNPYGAFASYVDQSTTANTATLMTLDTTDFSNGVSISSSKITVVNPGMYNLQFSVQLENDDNAPQDVFIWLKQNGTDITGSTGKVGLPARKSPGNPFHSIIGWNYFVSMGAGDYIEIYWSTTNASVTIQTYAASVAPTKPSTAAVVATLSFVSALY